MERIDEKLSTPEIECVSKQLLFTDHWRSFVVNKGYQIRIVNIMGWKYVRTHLFKYCHRSKNYVTILSSLDLVSWFSEGLNIDLTISCRKVDGETLSAGRNNKAARVLERKEILRRLMVKGM